MTSNRAALAVLVLMALTPACDPASPSETVPGEGSIRADDMRADLHFLAGAGLEGRGTQTRGNALAAEFIASRFARLGLEPMGDNGTYFQGFELMTTALGEGNSLATAVGGTPAAAQIGQEATPMIFSDSGQAAGSLYFAGFGIRAPSLGHDDFAGANIAGKIVLMLDHEPGENDPASPFDGTVVAEVARDWRKALAAQQAGAAGVLFVQDVHNHQATANVVDFHTGLWQGEYTYYTMASWMDRIQVPVMRISPPLAERLLAGGGRSLQELAAAAESAGAAAMDLPDVRLAVSAQVQRTRLPDRNVVGMLRGSDPALADEAVLVCAHYDHDGIVGGRIRPGADDDGSGTVGVIEIAEAYALAAAAGARPRRSVLFAVWNSEEVGLFGAWAYTEQPIVPLADLVGVLNMDMIGRHEEVPADGGSRFFGLRPQTAQENADSVHVMGYSYSSLLRDTIIAANEPIGLTLEQELDDSPSQMLRRSDHWPFLQMGVPAAFFHTGLHPDYHRETDTPDRINYAKMERIARLVHASSWALAQRDERPALDLRRGTLQ